MSAHYDSFDYPSYWIGRDYEHKSETLAIKKLLSKIDKINYVLEIGAGYGRLLQSYLYRAKKVYLSDPSAKLLSFARNDNLSKKVQYIQSTIDKLPAKLSRKEIDLVIFVRVLHHIKNIDESFRIIRKLLKENGYLILEYPNKLHSKAFIIQLLRGNFTFLLDILPKDIRSKYNQELNTLPFFNYHPDDIKYKLIKNKFEIIDILSVSNIRSDFIKKYLPLDFLLYFENLLQKPLSFFNFGPSVFILAKKK